MMNTFTLLGATGNVGKQATQQLLKSGHQTRAIVRNVDAESAQALKKSGATIVGGGFVEGDEKLGQLSVDEKALTEAFSNVDGVFAIIPSNLQDTNPDAGADAYMQVVKKAVQNAKVKKLVLLSGYGAQHATGTGQVQRFHRLESTFLPLAGPELRVVVVRASYFFTNLLWSFAALPHGVFPFPYAPEWSRNMISPLDVGDEIAKQLMDDTKGGSQIIEISGPESLCFADITQSISEIVGKKIQYVQQPTESLVPTYISYGTSPLGAEALAGMDAAAISGMLVPEHPENVVRGSRKLKDWLEASLKH